MMTNVTGICAGLPVAPADVTVTCPVCVPVARPAGLSVTVIVAAPAPLLGAALSHVVSVAAPQDRMPPPGFVTLSVRIFDPLPCWALSRSDVGVTDSTGCRIRKITGTFMGPLFASGDEMTTVSVFVPTDSVSGCSVRTMSAAPVPADADNENQGRFSTFAAVQLIVPPSPFAIWMASVRATVEPTFAESATLSGVTTSTGCCRLSTIGIRLVPPWGDVITTVSR